MRSCGPSDCWVFDVNSNGGLVGRFAINIHEPLTPPPAFFTSKRIAAMSDVKICDFGIKAPVALSMMPVSRMRTVRSGFVGGADCVGVSGCVSVPPFSAPPIVPVSLVADELIIVAVFVPSAAISPSGLKYAITNGTSRNRILETGISLSDCFSFEGTAVGVSHAIGEYVPLSFAIWKLKPSRHLYENAYCPPASPLCSHRISNGAPDSILEGSVMEIVSSVRENSEVICENTLGASQNACAAPHNPMSTIITKAAIASMLRIKLGLASLVVMLYK